MKLPDRARRYLRDSLHIRHDRTAERRGVDAFQYDVERHRRRYSIHLPVLDFTDGEQKTCLITLPLFHTTGQTVQMNTNMYGGNRIVLLPRFEPKATLEAMEKENVNFWVGVPTMFWAILKYVEENGYDISEINKIYESSDFGRRADAGRSDEGIRTNFRNSRARRLRFVGNFAAGDF